MRVIVEVRKMGPQVKRALGRYGIVVNESHKDRSYVLLIPSASDPGLRQVAVERECQNIGHIEAVSRILFPGYHTLRPDRWDP